MGFSRSETSVPAWSTCTTAPIQAYRSQCRYRLLSSSPAPSTPSPDELLEDLPPLGEPGWSIGLTYSDFRRFCAAEGDRRFRADLVEIARILQPVRAHFGFRVREEIERYIANGAGLMAPDDLFDLQIHQKLLPKVRGSGTTLEMALTQLRDLAAGRGWQRSAAKAEEMLGRLMVDGITHFYR